MGYDGFILRALLQTSWLLLAISFGAGGCAELGLPVPGAPAAAIVPPNLTFQGATLARAPSAVQLAAYYCPEVATAPFGGAALLCQGLFGGRPDPATMAVSFDVRFRVANPNQVPVPLSSLLAAVTVFPAAGNQRLGAACVSFCAPDAPGCTGGPDPNACQSSSRDIHSFADYAAAAAPLVAIAGMKGDPSQVPSLLVPKVAAGGTMDVIARMSFEPAELLAVLRQLAIQSTDELKKGRTPTFAIPYRLEGTVWFDVGAAGRVAVPWGPTEGTFVLPIQGLSLI
jgi:hypothetical protein